MNDQKWFSAKLRFVVLVEPLGGDMLYDRLFLLKAENFDSAFLRATSLGKSKETEYRNSDDKQVLWKFIELLSLDIILCDNLDGAELFSESKINPGGRIPFDQIFKPEMSRPVQTI